MGPPPTLQVRELVRRYSAESVVGPLSFAVNKGEFFSLLGPSGCGKTTTLRCIAGFERVDAGEIVLDGRPIQQVPPHRRGVGLVFQSHALFPHLSVRQNVAFGLEVHKVRKAEIERRVASSLALVELGAFTDRMPHQLSGGQQQRVALARSLVMEPPLLLLDEPMSSLDLKLRVQMRDELRDLQRRLGTTTVFVTHDQTEALALSDRIAVLSQGRIEQVGTPQQIYLEPASRFVAEFVGLSNLLDGTVVGRTNGVTGLVTASGLNLLSSCPPPAGASASILIRPERVLLAPPLSGDAANVFQAQVQQATYLGEDAQFRLLVDGREVMTACCKSGPGLPGPGATVPVHVEPRDVFVIAG
jgi:putative spermidine/putrescine transport system ATP-binding protein